MKTILRTLLCGLLLVLCAGNISAQEGSTPIAITASAGSATVSPLPLSLRGANMSILTIDWTSHASAGTVTASLTGMPKLWLRGIDFIAGSDLSTATPTDNYDFVIRPVYTGGRKGKDLLGAVEDAAAADGPDAVSGLGIGMNLKSAATEDSADGNRWEPFSIPFGATSYSIEGSTLGNSKQGKIVMYFSDTP